MSSDRGPRKTPVRPLLVAGVVLAAGVIALVLFLRGNSDDGAPAAAPTTSTSSPSFPVPAPVTTVAPDIPFTSTDADRMSTGLESADATQVADLLVPELRDPFLSSGQSAVPAGCDVAVLTDRFFAVQPDYGSVPVQLTGSCSGNYVATLYAVDGVWLVASIEEVE